MKRLLTGEWLFRSTDQEFFLPAVVPGCQFLDLMKNDLIEDPFFGTNEKDVQWVHEKDFLYQKTFSVTEKELAYKRIDLVFSEVDTVAEIKLNGKTLSTVENCFLPYRFSVKEELKIGQNILEIIFFSPKQYVEKKYRVLPTPMNANGLNGIVHIRKPQCHFGWDWGPNLIPVGLGKEVYLELSDAPKIAEPRIRTVKVENGFFIEVSAENAETITVTHPDGKTENKIGEKAEFLIVDPQIWWTKELSGKDSQPLYTVTAKNSDDEITKKIGLRTIELNREKDEFGYNFQFLLNGVPLFIKGANYIPPDSFATRFSKEKLHKLLDAVVFSNMNMIRVWGGGYYADDALLDECDRRGILVWQDFPFACQAYPFFDEEFLQNVLAEVAYNVKRMQSHPCLAVWCGNNEIEEMHLSWAAMHRYVEWTEKFFYHILPDALVQYDDLTPYTPGSPVGTAHNKNVRADFVGDTHLWGVWHGLQPMDHYRKRLTRFCSEFGFESLPSFKTIRSYAEKKDYPLSSAVQKSHQKCVGGNDKMLKYISTRFPLSDDIEDLVYLSQVTQATCISDATEHWRRNKGRCNGAMYWQLNDCWPTCSWSGYDYYGEYKALLYAGKEFFAPLCLSVEDGKKEIKVYLLNDLPDKKDVEVEWIRFDFSGKNVRKDKKTYSIEGLKNKLLLSIPVKGIDGKREGLAFRLYENGKMIQQKVCLLEKEKKLLLEKAPIKVEEKEENGEKVFTLFSPVFQRLVMLENESENPFSDNYFDLLPGERKVVTQKCPAEKPRVRTVSDVQKISGWKVFSAQIKVYLSLRNLANMFYHARVPKERE